MPVKRFRKKPIVIEAIQLTSESFDECCRFVGDSVGVGREKAAVTIPIVTMEGVMNARLCDWIIKGIKGEFYPCNCDIFHATYEEVK